MSFGPPIDGLRTLRMVVVLIACGVIMNTCGVVTSFVMNAARVEQINKERAENIRRTCEDVNARNAASLLVLDRLLEQRAGNASLRRSRQTTKLLIDTLVPRRDCDALAREQVDTTTN